MIKTTTTLHRLSRLLIFALALMLVIGAGFPTPTRAQNDPDTTWYWATTPEGLVAYTADGEVNLLIQDRGLVSASFSGYRFGRDSALLQNGDDFYWVISNSAQKFSIGESITNGLHPVNFHLPYILLSPLQSTVASTILNVKDFQLIPLSGNAILPRFLPDGETLRYVTYQRENDQILGTTLWEIDLARGHQSILHEHDGLASTMYSTPDGLQWWFIYNFRLGDASNAEVVTIGDPNPEYTQWIATGTAYIVNEWLFHDLPCPGQCATEVYLLTAEPNLRYQLSNSQYVPRSLYHFADDSLWLSGPSGVSLLDSAGKVLDFGQIAWGVRGPFFSKDGRWAISISHSIGYLEFPRTLYIWYLPYRAIMFELQLEWAAEVQFFENTVLVVIKDPSKRGVSAFVAWRDYNYQIGFSNVTVRDFLPGEFFQALADGNMLFVAPQSGIFRYDAATGSSNEIVPDGQPIIIDELA